VRGTIDHRPDRTKPWRARYLAPNGKQPSKSFTTKEKAQRWLRHQISKIDNDAWVDPAYGRRRYRDHAEDWLDGLVGLKPKTRHGYAAILRSRVLPEFGETQIRLITKAKIRRWVADMDGGGLSSSRIRQCHQVLRASLQQAVNDGLIGQNRATGVKLPSQHSRDLQVLTPSQVRLLAEAADRHQPGAGTLITFLAYTGLRWGEAAALTVADFDELHRKVTISRSATEVGGHLVVGTPKTHRVRTIVLPRTVNNQVSAHIAEEGLATTDSIFQSPDGTKLRSSNFRSRVWTPILATLSPEDAAFFGLWIHDLRHTAASLAISVGANVKAVQQMLGHRYAATTLDVYGHLYVDDLEDLADRLDERLSAIA